MQVLTDTKFEFMGRKNIAIVFSSLLLLASIGGFFTKGLNLGLDFTGGTLIELGYESSVELEPIRQLLAENKYKKFVVQHFGTSKDVLIRLAPENATDVDSQSAQEKDKESNKLIELINASGEQKAQIRRVEFVGPQVGEELKEQGGLAVLYALICIFVYVFLRFEWRFAVGSVIALFHDVLITVGVFSLLGLEFDLTVLAACLAVIGYSLNDTIVVFDRIRENFRKMRKGNSTQIINKSLNDTLSRTIITSITTLLVLVALFIFGGELINGFSTALIVGVVIGTYSSIYVASTTALLLGVSKQDLMQPQKEKVGDGDVV